MNPKLGGILAIFNMRSGTGDQLGVLFGILFVLLNNFRQPTLYFLPKIYPHPPLCKWYSPHVHRRTMAMEGSSQGPPQEYELNSRLNAWKSQGSEPLSTIDPFATSQGTAPNTAPGSRFPSSVALHRTVAPPVYFKSRRVRKGEQERPWLKETDPKEKWVWIIPVIGLLIGLGLTALQVWFGLQRISKHSYCQVLDEDWSGGFNEQVWTKEVEVGGFG